MVMATRRFFAPSAYLGALPPSKRLALYGFVSVMLAASRNVDDLYGESMVVDAPRSELARICGISVRTVRRHEEALVELGVARVLLSTGNRRVLELIEPGFNPAMMANRAVDNSRLEATLRRSQVDTGDHLRWTPVSTSERSSPIADRESERGRQARAHAGELGRRPAAQSANCPSSDLTAAVARGILLAARQRLEQEATESTRHGRTLTRRQAVECGAAIEQRLGALKRSGAGELAIDLTKRDVDRVVEYSLRAARPAAHLHSSLMGGDWRSDPAPGSMAEGVKTRGRSAEMPQERGRRDGPTWDVPGVSTAAELERLVRALDATGTGGARRRLALSLTGSKEVADLAYRLERAAIQMAAAGEASRG